MASTLSRTLSTYLILNRGFFNFGGAMGHKMTMPADHEVLPGRENKMRVSPTHTVTNNPTTPPFPDNTEMTIFGMGCFWGVERKFWNTKGVYSTHVGYSAGKTPNPSYEEVCTGNTGHNEVVRVVFDPKIISYEELLQVFWENHNKPKECVKEMIEELNIDPEYIIIQMNIVILPRKRRKLIKKRWIIQVMEKLQLRF